MATDWRLIRERPVCPMEVDRLPREWYGTIMTATLQIQQMTRVEKLQVMEAIWADLSRTESEVESPAWHADVLRETEARVTSGQERIADWEIAKRELRKRYSTASRNGGDDRDKRG